MKQPLPKYPRILALSLSRQGFGFVLMEGVNVLVDWGVKYAYENKNVESLAKLAGMISHYQPDVIAIEDASHDSVRRSARIRRLTKQVVRLGAKQGMAVTCFSRTEIFARFFPDGSATKYDLAQKLANKFSDELALRLPPKRRAWESEDFRMKIFEAVALALMVRPPNATAQASAKNLEISKF